MMIKIKSISHLSIGICFLSAVLSCTTPQPRKPIVQKTSSFLQESIERNKRINKLEEQVLLAYMKSDTTYNFVTSENGFWYAITTKNEDSTILPKTGDEVTFTYEIKDINDKIIYTQQELGERRYLVDKQELITGLQEGVKLMKQGETATFLFPSYKAYGYSGYQKIKSNEPLVYTVTLLRIDSTKN